MGKQVRIQDPFGSWLSPVDASAESYERRLKKVVIPMGNIYRWLTSKGGWATNVEGWPTDARIVGGLVQRSPFALILYLYHTDFPVNPIGREPEAIKLTWNRIG